MANINKTDIEKYFADYIAKSITIKDIVGSNINVAIGLDWNLYNMDLYPLLNINCFEKKTDDKNIVFNILFQVFVKRDFSQNHTIKYCDSYPNVLCEENRSKIDILSEAIISEFNLFLKLNGVKGTKRFNFISVTQTSPIPKGEVDFLEHIEIEFSTKKCL